MFVSVFTRAKSCTHNITTKEELFKVSVGPDWRVKFSRSLLVQIGKELFSKEKPAKLRLIGLRVTHLKDLREQQGQGQGIERVCLLHYPTCVSCSACPLQFLGPSTSRPAPQKRKSSNDGYMVEDDDDLILGDYESDVDAAPADAVRLDKKPRSAPLPPRSPQRAVVRLKPQTCPVCLRELEVDNAALNAHIDFCLSKGTIAETVAEGEERNSNGARKRAKKADPFDKFRR